MKQLRRRTADGQLPGVGHRGRSGAQHHCDELHDGPVDIGIVAYRDQVPDVWTLLDGLDLSLTELGDARR